jgi:hypothetical protein
MKLMAIIKHPYHYEDDVKRAYSSRCRNDANIKRLIFVLLSTISLQLNDKIECHQRCGIT